jgi:putative SOS response-associated peptidase YedK
MLRPYNADEMEAYPVSNLVNKVGFNTSNPDVINRQEYPELAELS